MFDILLQALLVTSTYSGALYKPNAGSSVATEWGSWSNSMSSGMYLKSSTFPLSSNSVPSHSSYSTSAVAESKHKTLLICVAQINTGFLYILGTNNSMNFQVPKFLCEEHDPEILNM